MHPSYSFGRYRVALERSKGAAPSPPCHFKLTGSRAERKDPTQIIEFEFELRRLLQSTGTVTSRWKSKRWWREKTWTDKQRGPSANATNG